MWEVFSRYFFKQKPAVPFSLVSTYRIIHMLVLLMVSNKSYRLCLFLFTLFYSLRNFKWTVFEFTEIFCT
jgi:hypothetical protein